MTRRVREAGRTPEERDDADDEHAHVVRHEPEVDDLRGDEHAPGGSEGVSVVVTIQDANSGGVKGCSPVAQERRDVRLRVERHVSTVRAA